MIIVIKMTMIIIITTMNSTCQGQIDHQLRPIRAHQPVGAVGPACHVIKMNVVIIVIKIYLLSTNYLLCHVIKMNVIEECHGHLVIIVVIVIKNHHYQSYQNAQDYNGYH